MLLRESKNIPTILTRTDIGTTNKTVAAINCFIATECCEWDIWWVAKMRMHISIASSTILSAREIKTNFLAFHIDANVEIMGRESSQQESDSAQ